MKKLLFIIAGCWFFLSSFSSPIHFFNLPQDDEEFSFFSKSNEVTTEDAELAEEQESESAKQEQAVDQVASNDESESWFFSRFSMLANLDDESDSW
jgi:hypothetical protein